MVRWDFFSSKVTFPVYIKSVIIHVQNSIISTFLLFKAYSSKDRNTNIHRQYAFTSNNNLFYITKMLIRAILKCTILNRYRERRLCINSCVE